MAETRSRRKRRTKAEDHDDDDIEDADAFEDQAQGDSQDDDFAPRRTASGRVVSKPKFYGERVSSGGLRFAGDSNGGGSSKRSTAPRRMSASEEGINLSSLLLRGEPSVERSMALPELSQAARAPKKEDFVEEITPPPKPEFDLVELEALGKEYPDNYWKLGDAIDFVNAAHPLTPIKADVTHPGQVHGLVLSDDGELLASASSMGTVRIWDTRRWTLLQELRDATEENIEEFYTVRFSPNSKFIAAAGKLKLRDAWNEEEADNQITPSAIKIFDAVTSKVVARLQGHTEEILCLKRVVFKGENYFLSSSQDGRIIKWPMNEDWSALRAKGRFIADLSSYYVFSLSFLPGSGNRYFLAAADETVKLYDFDTGQILQAFGDMFSCYCDCVKFINPVELEHKRGQWYFLARGVELLKDDDSGHSIKPNTVTLSRLIAPDSPTGEWTTELVQTYKDKDYQANSWPIKLTSNGRYVIAPTSFGEVFIWNLKTGVLAATLVEHKEKVLTDAMIHPTRPFLLTCGHDSQIKVYTPASPPQ